MHCIISEMQAVACASWKGFAIFAVGFVSFAKKGPPSVGATAYWQICLQIFFKTLPTIEGVVSVMGNILPVCISFAIFQVVKKYEKSPANTDEHRIQDTIKSQPYLSIGIFNCILNADFIFISRFFCKFFTTWKRSKIYLIEISSNKLIIQKNSLILLTITMIRSTSINFPTSHIHSIHVSILPPSEK